jgi:hypothetical protein
MIVKTAAVVSVKDTVNALDEVGAFFRGVELMVFRTIVDPP